MEGFYSPLCLCETICSFKKITLLQVFYNLSIFGPAFCFFKVPHVIKFVIFVKNRCILALCRRKLLDCIAHPALISSYRPQILSFLVERFGALLFSVILKNSFHLNQFYLWITNFLLLSIIIMIISEHATEYSCQVGFRFFIVLQWDSLNYRIGRRLLDISLNSPMNMKHNHS